MTAVILHNAMLEDRLDPGFWSVAQAAERWREVRGRLLPLTESLDEDSGDTLESLCFVVDVVLSEAAETGSLDEYATALQEIADVLLVETVDPRVQTLVVSEMQKLLLPA